MDPSAVGAGDICNRKCQRAAAVVSRVDPRRIARIPTGDSASGRDRQISTIALIYSVNPVAIFACDGSEVPA